MQKKVYVNPFSTLSLATRLSLQVSVLILCLVSVSVAAIYRRGHAETVRKETNAVRTYATLFEGLLERAVDLDDQANAFHQLSLLADHPDMEYAVLLRGDGSVLAPWTRPGRLEAIPDEAVGPNVASIGIAPKSPEWRFVHPFTTRIGRSAVLVFGLNPARLRHQRDGWFAWIGWLGIAATLLVASSAYVTARIFLRPVTNITETATRIAAGEHEARINLDFARRDELGLMARALSQMLERLFAKEADIRALNEALELRVAERTEQLREANRQLESRLTELHSTQEQLVVSDRRVSIGILAAGVAHEINNPLSFVAGNLSFLSSELPALIETAREGKGRTPEFEEHVADAQQAIVEARSGCERVRKIVLGLKTFSRGDDGARHPVVVTEALESAISIASNEIRHRARLHRDFQQVPLVLASDVRLGQIFVNLLVNAAQAITPGAVEKNEVLVRAYTDTQGRAVIEVSDTGCGIPNDIRGRLFDPFFTTKPVGVGTGLGLSIVQGIVRALEGEIEVESEVGRGSTFRLRLPPAVEEHLPPSAARDPVALPEARLSITIIDDEALVLRAFERQLGRNHDVQSFSDPKAALKSLESFSDVDVVLCDLMMPEMSGLQFLQELRRVRPDLENRIVFLTGGAFTAEAQAFASNPAYRHLQKPVSELELQAVLRERST